MNNNYVSKIKEAEDKADAIMKKANNNANEMLDKANIEIATLKNTFEEDLNTMNESIIKEKTISAEAEVDSIKKEFDDKCNNIKADASKNISKAKDYVLNRIGAN